jgi:hypothetical protein
MLRSARFRIVMLLGPAAVLAGALTGAADPEPPTCQTPAAKTIRTDPPQRLVIGIACSDASGANVTYVVDAAPEHGTLETHTNSPGVYFYEPDAGYEGADSATFHATSANGDSAPVVQQITVDPDYNRAPTCDTTAVTVRTGRTREWAVDCFDPDGDALALGVADAPAHGTAEIVTSPFTGMRYTAGKDFLGDDPFSFTVDDGHGGTAVWEIVATIIDQNQAPVCSEAFTVATEGKVRPIGPAGSCHDPDGDPLSFEVADQPAHGNVAWVAVRGWLITVEKGFVGDDAVTWRASDGIASTTFLMKVKVVDGGEHPPECDVTQAAATSGVTTAVQLRCFDRDLDVARFEIREGPAAGTGTLGDIDQATMTVPFTSDPGFVGTARFVYGAVDSDGSSNSAVAEIVVSAPPAADGGGAVAAQKDETPPALRVAPAARQALASVLGGGVRLVVQVDEPATLTVRATVDARSARRLGLARRAKKPVLVGRATRSVAAGRTVVRVKLSRKARRALRKQRRRATTLRLTATVTDGAGNRRALPARVLVR